MSTNAGPAGRTAPVIEPATEEWLAALAAAGAGGPPLYELSPADARQVLRDVQTSVAVELEPADIEDRVIPGGPTGDVDIRIVRPERLGGIAPAIVYTHGGGWILGDKDTHERLVREVADAAGAVVVFVDYTPAPEAHYPVQNEQAYTALEWVAEHAGEIGADPSRIAVMGDSVGGNMAIALTLMAKQRRGPSLAAQVLFYPVTDADFETSTYERYADGPWLTRPAMQWFWDAYAPDVARRSEPTASPLNAGLESLAGLPPALIVNGEHDVLAAEGQAYARRLTQAGTRTTHVRYSGTIHDFALLNPIAATPAPRAAIAQAGHFLRAALTA
jgi:acetyl esterase